MRKFFTYLFFLIIVFGIQALGSWLTEATVETWYRTIIVPYWTPPNQVFGPIWFVLYILVGCAGAMLWPQRKKTWGIVALCFWFTQLILNGLWSYFFFSLQSPLAGAIDLTFIATLSAVVVMSSYMVRKIASLFFLPYFLWIIYAATLNWTIFFLNR